MGRSGTIPDQLLRAWRGAKNEQGSAQDFVAAVARHATQASDPPAGAALTRDPEDDYLVRLALITGADVLVSGDRDLLEADLLTPKVLAPRLFLESIRGT